MVISAQLSVYPLRQGHLSPTIQAVADALTEAGLQPHVGPMSTVVTGGVASLFAALREAFVRAAATGDVVMTVALSNACPAGGQTPNALGHL
jgi:uncharacterized protein YqgV (UPF0045/DUF77 family)